MFPFVSHCRAGMWIGMGTYFPSNETVVVWSGVTRNEYKFCTYLFVACELQKHDLIKTLRQQLAEAQRERSKKLNDATTDPATQDNVCSTCMCMYVDRKGAIKILYPLNRDIKISPSLHVLYYYYYYCLPCDF